MHARQARHVWLINNHFYNYINWQKIFIFDAPSLPPPISLAFSHKSHLIHHKECLYFLMLPDCCVRILLPYALQLSFKETSNIHANLYTTCMNGVYTTICANALPPVL